MKNLQANNRYRLMIVVLSCLVIVSSAAAQSVFSRDGIGEWYEGYDLRGEALGGTGIGTIDQYNFSSPNPAAPAFALHTLGYVGVRGAVNISSDDFGNESSVSSGRVSGLGVHIPLGSKWGMGFSVRPQTDGVYTLEESIVTGPDDSGGTVHREEGSRGLIRYNMDLTWRGGRSWALGLRGGLLAGSLLNKDIFESSEEGFQSSESQRLLVFHAAPTVSGGFQWSPASRIGVGAVFSINPEMTVDETFRGPGGTEWKQETKMQLPSGVGGGLSAFVNERLRLSGDVFYRNWDDYRLGGNELTADHNTGFQSTVRWGLGLERTPRMGLGTSFFDRLSLRLGLAIVPWYIEDATGETINERRLSCGFGLPVRKDRGRLEFLLSWVHRGNLADNGMEEDMFVLGWSCSFARVLRDY